MPQVAMALACTLLAGCVAPVGPVEVTRFHLPDTALLGRGSIAVEPAPGVDGNSLEFRSYQTAVADQLARLGYGAANASGDDSVASLRLDRETMTSDTGSSRVTVAMGGSNMGSGTSVGMGLGFALGGHSASGQVRTELAVSIRQRATGQVLWEGRASFTVAAGSPLAQTQLAAPKLAAALFAGFPGNSGETISVQP